MLKWFFGILIVLGIGAAAAWWWLNRPMIVRHPEFGTDCAQLVSTANVQAQVECIRVWYGTNRQLEIADTTRTSDTTDVLEANGESGDELRLGRADIWLPKLQEDGGSRARGETPHVKGAVPNEPNKLAEYVFLTRITTSGRETFSSTLQNAIYEDGSDAVLLFVHGFNVKFDDALVRTAQLSNDLSRNEIYDVGAPVLFSWPSAGEVSLDTYQGDRDRSLGAAPYLEAFLDLLTEDLDVERINIIAHSMGNRVLTEALENYARDYLIRHNRDDLEFRILLVAADVERDVFAAANGVFDNLDANVTIYTSDTDRALHVSNIVNQKKRLGDTDKDKPFIRADQHYQTIDATAVTTELFGTGHSYYSDNPTILWDMMCTIGETRPQDRALEIARYGGLPDGDQYYRVNSSISPDAKACTLHRSAFPPRGRAVERSDDARRMEPLEESTESPKPDTSRGLTAPPPAPPEPMVEIQSLPTLTVLYVANYEDLDMGRYEPLLEQALDPDKTVEGISISAYSDTAGTEAENRVQTLRFASAVRDWFVARGVDESLIIVIGYGEDNLAIETADGVAEDLNRRVEIEINYSN